jgi:hypothetical protein
MFRLWLRGLLLKAFRGCRSAIMETLETEITGAVSKIRLQHETEFKRSNNLQEDKRVAAVTKHKTEHTKTHLLHACIFRQSQANCR